MDISITLDGLDALKDELAAKAAAVVAATSMGVEEGGELVQGLARANVAAMFYQRTGELLSSITWWMPGPFEAEIAPHVIYGRIQELGGTVYPHGHPYLRFIPGGGKSFFNDIYGFTSGQEGAGGLMTGDFVFTTHSTLTGRHYLLDALEEGAMPWLELMDAIWAEAWD